MQYFFVNLVVSKRKKKQVGHLWGVGGIGLIPMWTKTAGMGIPQWTHRKLRESNAGAWDVQSLPTEGHFQRGQRRGVVGFVALFVLLSTLFGRRAQPQMSRNQNPVTGNVLLPNNEKQTVDNWNMTISRFT